VNKESRVIKLPSIPSEISIAPDWLTTRAEIIEAASAVTGIETSADFDAAGELLRRITKTSNAMERFRKDMTAPLTEASRVVKKAADAAREPLENAKQRVQQLLNAYAAEQQRKAEEERRRIEAEQRRAVEEQLAKQQAEREAATELGFDEPDEPEPEPEVPAIIPQVDRARADAVRVQESIDWEIVDEGAIPRVFLMLDPRRVNGFVAQHKDRIRELLKEQPDEAAKLVPGIRFRIETKVISR
jgi:vacuolar-type H+-ATPase subunit H